MKFKVGDFSIEYNGYNYVLEVKAAEYISDFDKSNLRISLTEEAIKAEMADNNPPIPYMRAENNLIHREIGEWLPLNNAFVMHGATIDFNGSGVVFTAHSGTGKTTHMLLWQKLLGDRLTIVNGDKPIIRFFDDEPNTPYAYGTPWNGKERFGCNMRTPLKHICFIERAEENSCEKIAKEKVINQIFNQVYMPKDPVAAANTIGLINRLISSCDLWLIKCNMDISAAETAYNTIFG